VPLRIARSLLLLLVVVAAASSALADPDTWYAETVSESSRGFLVTHYWSKGPWLRSETVIQGHRVVTIVNGERYSIIDALTQEGVSIQRAPAAIAEDKTRGRPFATEFQELMAMGGEKVDEQPVNGVLTDVYRATDDRGRSTVWVTHDEPHFPVRAEYYSRMTKERSVTSYVNWLSALSIPDSFFEPAPDVKLEHVTYEQYVERSRKEPVGPAPVMHRQLLHGRRK
jgi:hypothetical protein